MTLGQLLDRFQISLPKFYFWDTWKFGTKSYCDTYMQ